jgi:bacterioferritin
MTDNFAFTDVATLRQQARQHTEDGAVTAGYNLDRERLLKLLNEALATELVCVLRYRRHHFAAHGLRAQNAAEEFMVHANQELQHADQIAARIVQLGGEPDFSPSTLLQRSHAEYIEGVTLQDMIRENLVAERIAIESYRELIQYVGNSDPTTRRMLEEILMVEEQHADELSDWLPPQNNNVS